LDPQYQLRYAQAYQAQVLKSEKSKWLDEYRQVLADEDLSSLLANDHPHIMPWLLAKLEVIRIAERLAVEPPPPPPAPESKQKPKLTRQEWEARIDRYRQRQLDRMRVEADDKIARMLERYESARRLRERSEEMGLDEDVIVRLEQQLLGDLDQDEEDTGKGFKQL
jgi:hypothetical protein